MRHAAEIVPAIAAMVARFSTACTTVAGNKRARTQHRVPQHHAEARERQRVQRVAHLRDVAGQQREHEPGGEQRDEARDDAPVLGVAPVAPEQLGAAGADEDRTASR